MFRLDADWELRLPESVGVDGWISGLACDSRDNLYVHSRSRDPLVVVDPEGGFVRSIGRGVLTREDAHGIFIDEQDRIFCTELNHCVRQFDTDGELVRTLGTPGSPGADKDGFHSPTDCVVIDHRNVYVSDGYDNNRIHHYRLDGTLVHSWGEDGSGPGQFDLPHCVRVGPTGRLWVCDRANDRIQIFDQTGELVDQIGDLRKPDALVFFGDKVVVAEMEHRVSVLSLDGDILFHWGDGRADPTPGMFEGAPHGICLDSRHHLYVSEVGVDGRIQRFNYEPRPIHAWDL